MDKFLSKNDHSDRKSLDLLTRSLNQITKEKSSKGAEPSTSGNNRSPKKKTSNISKTKSSPRQSPHRKRKLERAAENNTKLTPWLNKENLQQAQKDKKAKANHPKPKPLDVSVTKARKNKINKTKFERTASFEKYGIALPSYEKILEDQKMFDEHKRQVKLFDALDEDDKILEEVFNNDSFEDSKEKFTGELLDCRHLSLDEVDEYIDKYMTNMRDIMNGKVYHDRHQRFHNFNPRFEHTTKDLTYSTSLVVFTQEQKDRMLDRMRVELDPEDNLTHYFFKVLLPELCLSIFKDVHKMSKKEANKYLNERPLDI